VIHSLHALIAD
jgi:hypothetical protein